MSLISFELNQRSVLALVASDMSYRPDPDIVIGDSPLATYQDSSPESDLFPAALAAQAGIPYDNTVIIGGKSEIALGDWTVRGKRYDPNTGFSSLILYSPLRNEYIVACTGTNGPDSQDWYADLNLATTQWEAANGLALLEQLEGLLAQNADAESAHITFAGQSLGGALSQFAAYDFVARQPTFARNQLTLVTFNGLGAYGGIRAMRGDSFDGNALAGVGLSGGRSRGWRLQGRY